MSEQDSACIRNITVVISALFVFFIAMIFLARTIIY